MADRAKRFAGGLLVAVALLAARGASAAAFLDRPSMMYINGFRLLVILPKEAGSASPSMHIVNLDSRRVERTLPYELQRTTLVAGAPGRVVTLIDGEIHLTFDSNDLQDVRMSVPWGQPRALEGGSALIVAAPLAPELHILPCARAVSPVRISLVSPVRDLAVTGEASIHTQSASLTDDVPDVVAVLADGSVGYVAAGRGGWQQIRPPAPDGARCLASGGEYDALVLWGEGTGFVQFYDTSRRMALRMEQRHDSAVTAASGSRLRVSTGDEQGRIVLWDWQSQSMEGQIEDSTSAVVGLAQRDGELVVLRQSGDVERYDAIGRFRTAVYEAGLFLGE